MIWETYVKRRSPRSKKRQGCATRAISPAEFDRRFEKGEDLADHLDFDNATKVRKEVLDYGFGFPVRLLNVPTVRIRGAWTPQVPYNRISKALLRALASKTGRLTGDQVRFIRQSLQMTLEQFGLRFDVSRIAVDKWEKSGDEATAMTWPTEKDLRIFLLTKDAAKPQEIAALYAELEDVPRSKGPVIELDTSRLLRERHWEAAASLYESDASIPLLRRSKAERRT